MSSKMYASSLLPLNLNRKARSPIYPKVNRAALSTSIATSLNAASENNQVKSVIPERLMHRVDAASRASVRNGMSIIPMRLRHISLQNLG